MAIYKPSVIAVDIRGSVGPAVFSKSHSGLTIRSRVKPINPNTSRQSLSRSYLATAAQAWSSTISATDRANWIAAAAALPATNRVGVATTLTAGQLYCRIQAFRQLVNLSILDDPAPAQTAAAPALVLSYSAGNIRINAAPTNLTTDGELALFVSGPWTTAREYPRGPWRAPVIANINSTFPLNILTSATAGARYFVRARFVDALTNVMSGGATQVIDAI